MIQTRNARRLLAGLAALGLALWLPSSALSQTCYGDTLLNAGGITPSGTNQTVSGSVLAAQGNYYSFTVASTAGYVFSLCAARGGSATYDSYLCLLDSTFALLVGNDDFCGVGSQVSRSLAPGTYYIAVSSYGSSSGNYTLAYASDATPPLGGTVNDGSAADVTWQDSASTISANWSGFSDAESGPVSYEYAIGTSPGGTDIRAFYSSYGATSATVNYLSLVGSATYFVTVRATNGAGLQTSVSSNGVTVYTMGTSASMPGAILGQAYAQSLPAGFGTGPYTWVQERGDLPPGLSLAGNGTISGTPIATGGFLFGCLVTDALAATRHIAYSILVLDGTGGPIVTSGNTSVPTPLPSVPIYSNYSHTVSASGGLTPYVWSVSAGSLPTGLILDSLTGALTGWSSAAGTFSFTLTATDTDDPSQRSSALLTLQVTGSPGGLYVSTASSLPGGATNCPYALLPAATGGTRPYTWSVSSGSLPPGLTLTPGGILSGIPSSIGTSLFTLTVTDAAAVTANLSASLLIVQGLEALQITPTTLPLAAQGVLYPSTLSATGGTPGYVWNISSGSLPPGMSLNPVSGAITGTATASGPYRFVVRALDSGTPPSSTMLQVELNVLRTASTGYLIVTPSPLPDATLGAAYQTSMAVVGGNNPHAWTLFSGTLPPGLSLNANTGEISGTPGSAGTYSFVLEASNNGGILSSVRLYSLTVTGGAPPAAGGSGDSGGGCGLLGLEPVVGILCLRLLRRRRKALRAAPRHPASVGRNN